VGSLLSHPNPTRCTGNRIPEDRRGPEYDKNKCNYLFDLNKYIIVNKKKMKVQIDGGLKTLKMKNAY